MTVLSKTDATFRRWLTSQVSPETFTKIYSLARPLAIQLEKHLAPKNMVETGEPIELFENGLVFRNGLGNAAGMDKEGELLEFNYMTGAGFAVVGTVLNQPNPGNLIRAFGINVNPWVPLPFDGSAINSLGLPSKGVEVAIRNIYEFRTKHNPRNFPIGMSVMGHPMYNRKPHEHDYEACQKLKVQSMLLCIKQARAYVDFFEINESCPNVAHAQGSDDDLIQRLQMAVAIAHSGPVYRPVLAKLGAIGDAAHTVEVMTRAGVDGIVAINTQNNYAELAKKIHFYDRKIFDYYTQKHKGGVSGRAIRDIAKQSVDALAEEIHRQGSSLKLIHVGGIAARKDMKSTSADLCEWYTGYMSALSCIPIEEVQRSMMG